MKISLSLSSLGCGHTHTHWTDTRTHRHAGIEGFSRECGKLLRYWVRRALSAAGPQILGPINHLSLRLSAVVDLCQALAPSLKSLTPPFVPFTGGPGHPLVHEGFTGSGGTTAPTAPTTTPHVRRSHHHHHHYSSTAPPTLCIGNSDCSVAVCADVSSGLRPYRAVPDSLSISSDRRH